MLDLRSPQIPEGDIQIALDLDRAALTLLVGGDAIIDQWDLTWTGGGKIKQTFHQPVTSTGRRSGSPGTSVTAKSGCTAAGSRSYRRSAHGSFSPTHAVPAPAAA